MSTKDIIDSEKLPLVVDASSSPIQLGIPSSNGWEKIIKDPGQAMEGIFRGIQQLFEGRTDSLNSVDCVYYCCGPGSTLGLRLAAAFVKTLQWESGGKTTIYQYNALDLAASLPQNTAQYTQAPFRMGRRFVRTGPQKSIGKKEILDEDQAIADYPDSFHLTGPRAISAEVPKEKILNYELEQIAGLEVLHLISEPTDMPAPFNPEPTIFKRWEPSISAKQ
jgi:tRNA A37 threonylcarbamoyladenosine modification protein TsaB